MSGQDDYYSTDNELNYYENNATMQKILMILILEVKYISWWDSTKGNLSLSPIKELQNIHINETAACRSESLMNITGAVSTIISDDDFIILLNKCTSPFRKALVCYQKDRLWAIKVNKHLGLLVIHLAALNVWVC